MAQLQNLNENGIGLGGFDPVSYFTSKPVMEAPTLPVASVEVPIIS